MGGSGRSRCLKEKVRQARKMEEAVLQVMVCLVNCRWQFQLNMCILCFLVYICVAPIYRSARIEGEKRDGRERDGCGRNGTEEEHKRTGRHGDDGDGDDHACHVIDFRLNRIRRSMREKN